MISPTEWADFMTLFITDPSEATVETKMSVSVSVVLGAFVWRPRIVLRECSWVRGGAPQELQVPQAGSAAILIEAGFFRAKLTAPPPLVRRWRYRA